VPKKDTLAGKGGGLRKGMGGRGKARRWLFHSGVELVWHVPEMGKEEREKWGKLTEKSGKVWGGGRSIQEGE